MTKEQCIEELESGNPSKEAVEFATDALKKGSKSWKGYRRFKKKYVVLKHSLDLYRRLLLEKNYIEQLRILDQIIPLKEVGSNGE